MKNALVSFLAVVCLTFGQEVRGTLAGRILDSSGAPIPQAKVKVLNQETGLETSVVSNDSGLYVAPYLIPGRYTVRVEQPGFKKLERKNLEVRINDRLEVDLALSVGDVAETISVTAETPLLETSSASLGQVIDSRRVAELPIAHGNPFALIGTSGGAGFARSATLDRPFEPTHIVGYSMDGARANRSDVQIDGVSAAATAGNNEVTASYVPPADTVSEMKIQTAPFDATVGQTEGGVVNVSMKSGTNAFHGTGYYFAMNPALNANLFFANRQGQKIADFDYHRFGGTFSGPVVLPKVYNGKNKTFFMIGGESILETRPRGSILTVPDAAQRRGDFSGLLRLGAGYQIYDPATRTPAPGGLFQSQPLPGNIVPASRINATARQLLNFYALPNDPGTADGRNNLQLPNLPEPITYYTLTGRMDHNFTERTRVYVRGSGYLRDSNYDDFFNSIATGQYFQFDSKSGAVDGVHTFSPTLVLNVRAGYNRYIRITDADPGSRGLDLTTLGFPASYNNLVDPSVRRFPVINIGGYTSTYNGTLYRPTDTAMALASIDKLAGKHTIKFGMEYRAYIENQYADDNVSTGSFTFDSSWTRGPLNTAAGAPVGQSMASFLLGLPASGFIDRRASYAQKSSVWAPYFQDEWRIHSNLTLTLGLRYEVEGPLTERFDRTVRGYNLTAPLPIADQIRTAYARNPIPERPAAQFPVSGGLTFANTGGLPRTLWNTDRNNFMPRVGAAWKLGANTVIRGGYGIFYGFLGARRGDVIQTGFTQTTPMNPSLDGGLTFRATLSNPFPDGVIEPLGAAPGLMSNVGNAVTAFNQNPLAPMMQRWQVGIQRTLPGRWVAEATYVGNRGSDIELSRNLNAIPNEFLSTSPFRDQTRINFLSQNFPNPYQALLPGTGRAGALISRATLLTAYPHFTSINLAENTGSSSYHSAQFRLERRFSSGWTFQGAYTFSKFIESIGLLNGADVVPHRAISDQDFPHRFVATGIWELPFGKGRRFGSRGPGAELWSGWQVQGVYTFQSGQALGWGNVLFIGDIKNIPVENRTVDRWFNTGAGFERTPALQLASNLRTFPQRLSGVRGDGVNGWDLSAIKNTKLFGERVNAQLRGEFLNAFNTPNFSNPIVDPTNTAFGQVTSQKNYARRVQLAIRVVF